MDGLGIHHADVEMNDVDVIDNHEAQHHGAAEAFPTTPSHATLMTDQSNPSEDGDEVHPLQSPRRRKRPLDEDESVHSYTGLSHGTSPLKSPLKTPLKLGTLHQRRVSTSPEKFDKGKFEPTPIRTDLAAAEGPATKIGRAHV